MAFSVVGKTAVVTGAGSGICFSFAKLLLQQQCNVVLADLALRPEAESLLRDFSSTPRAVFQKTDVTKWDQLDRAFRVAAEEFGGYDIVCPGAGVYEPVSTCFLLPISSLSLKLTLGFGSVLFQLLALSGIATLQRFSYRESLWELGH